MTVDGGHEGLPEMISHLPNSSYVLFYNSLLFKLSGCTTYINNHKIRNNSRMT